MFHRNAKATFRRVAAIAAGMVLVAVTASIALANVGSPAITLTSTSGSLTVGASGTWTKGYVDNHYVGWAVSWGDGNSNALSNGTTTVHFASNAVSPGHNGTRQNGLSGTWTGGSHAYAAAGTYQVCVVMYDLGDTWPNSNSHRWIATGSNHNADNSMENSGAFTVGANCASVTVTVGKANQTITFGTLTNRRFDQSPRTISATASSGLPVTFTSGTASVCTVSGNSVTFVTTGLCTIRADQAGNGSFNAAPQVSRSFTITKGNQTITFATITGKRFDQSPLTVGGTATSGLAVAFTSGTTSVCTMSDNSVTFLALGTCTIRANQGGDANWNAASQVSRSFTVSKGAQTISFGTIANKTFDQTPLTIGATASSGLSVSFTSGTPTVCTVALTTVTFLATGDCTIRANQAGNTLWNAATQVSHTFTIGQGDQTIAFTSTAPSPAIVGGATYPVAATGGASGNPIVFSIDATATSVCSISGNIVSFIGSGSCVIDANQAGDARWNAATQVQQSFEVGKAGQNITFAALPNLNYGDPSFELTASASSTLPISYSVTGSCSLTDDTVTITGAGDCSVTASQAGDDDFGAAEAVVRSFTIGKAPLTITANDQTRPFGAADPTFSAAFGGWVNGDTAAGLTTQPTCTTTATASSPVGTAPITCSGAASDDYDITYVAGTLTISALPVLTITADNQSRAFGAADPAFTYVVSPSANLTTPAVCTTTATAASAGGTYPITCSGAALDGYSINYVAGTLTIASQELLGATATPTVAPTATQSQSLLGATSAPSVHATPPATSTPSKGSDEGGAPIVGLVICLAFGCLAMLVVDRQRRTVRR